jgi:hypothetical protein
MPIHGLKIIHNCMLLLHKLINNWKSGNLLFNFCFEMSNFKLVTLILILHFSCYDTRSLITSDVELKTKKPKKPSLEWSNPSSFSSNPTYPEILNLVKVNSAKECNLKTAVKFNKVLEVAKKLV